MCEFKTIFTIHSVNKLKPPIRPLCGAGTSLKKKKKKHSNLHLSFRNMLHPSWCFETVQSINTHTHTRMFFNTWNQVENIHQHTNNLELSGQVTGIQGRCSTISKKKWKYRSCLLKLDLFWGGWNVSYSHCFGIHLIRYISDFSEIRIPDLLSDCC